MPSQVFSPGRLARLRSVLSAHVERAGVPGLVAVFSRRGETHIEALGLQSFGESAPMRPDTLFRIASLTKPISAAAAMTLVEECKLRLDDPIDRILPELANRRVLKRLDGPLDDTVPALRPITLRDLLTFRLGFGLAYELFTGPPGRYPILQAMAGNGIVIGARSDSPHPPDEWLRRFASLPLMHQPGEVWMYHTGADILGVLMARVCGKPLEAVLRERLFDPLGMKDTAFSVPADKLARFTTAYQADPSTGALTVFDPRSTSLWARPPVFPSAGAGLVSTPADYLAFAQMLANNGTHNGRRILSRPSIEAMTTDHLTPAQKSVSGLLPHFFDTHGWGFGLCITTARETIALSPGSYGWDGGTGTSWRNDPQERLTGILFTQRLWTSPAPPDVTQDFWTSLYQAIDA